MNMKKRSINSSFMFMVEVTGIEPVSESIFTGFSPSAAFVLLFRFLQRPKAGFGVGYPVIPLRCRAFPQGFPACLTFHILPAGEQKETRGAELCSQCEIVCSFSVYI